MSQEENQRAEWYVIHTYLGYENKVADNILKVVENRKLQDLIQDVKIPTEIVTEIKDNVAKEIERKIYPCYVLVKMVMTDETWYVVRNTRGVTGFVGTDVKPIPLTEKEVESMGVEKKSVEVDYKVGDTVNIIDGPFANSTGIIESIDAENYCVRITIPIFGRETQIDLELDQVESLSE